MQQARIKKPQWGLVIIFGTLFVLVLILLATVGILIFTRQNSSNNLQASIITGNSPVNRLNVEAIDPALALASLGGVPESDVLTEAIEKLRPETALATLLFSSNLPAKESAGGLLQLAAVYTAGNAVEKASLSYRLAGTVATLAPDLPDTVRADLFVQAGEGLAGINRPAEAKFYFDQAFVIAAKSPYLQAVHRRRIFEQLHQNYLALGERAAARESLSLSANPPSLTLVAQTEAILPGGEPIPLPETAQIAEADRWQAAQELAAQLVQRGGQGSQETVNALAAALVAEDMQKLPYFRSEFENTSQLSKKMDITQAQIAWLSIKYRVAKQGYGISIVPDWEAQAEEIRSELTKSYETLFALTADWAVALPDVSQLDKATEERLRTEILAGELGRYPNYPEEQRRAQLLNATDQLLETQPEINIFIGVSELNGRKTYTLVAAQ